MRRTDVAPAQNEKRGARRRPALSLRPTVEGQMVPRDISPAMYSA